MSRTPPSSTNGGGDGKPPASSNRGFFGLRSFFRGSPTETSLPQESHSSSTRGVATHHSSIQIEGLTLTPRGGNDSVTPTRPFTEDTITHTNNRMMNGNGGGAAPWSAGREASVRNPSTGFLSINARNTRTNGTTAADASRSIWAHPNPRNEPLVVGQGVRFMDELNNNNTTEPPHRGTDLVVRPNRGTMSVDRVRIRRSDLILRSGTAMENIRIHDRRRRATVDPHREAIAGMQTAMDSYQHMTAQQQQERTSRRRKRGRVTLTAWASIPNRLSLGSIRDREEEEDDSALRPAQRRRLEEQPPTPQSRPDDDDVDMHAETKEILDTIPSPDPLMQRGTQSFPFSAPRHVPNLASNSGSSILMLEDVRPRVLAEIFPTAGQVTNYYTTAMEDNGENHFATEQEEDAALESQRAKNLKDKQEFDANAASNAAANENMAIMPLAEGVDRNELNWGNAFAKFQWAWKCGGCLSPNPDEATKCKSCSKVRPGYEKVEEKAKNDAASKAQTGLDPTQFQFGAAPTTTTTSTAAAPASAISFGSSSALAPANAPVASGFTFGGSSNAPAPANAPVASGFTFGGSSSAPAPADAPAASGCTFGGSSNAPAPANAPVASGFTFGGSSIAPASADAPAASGFTYGGSSSAPAPLAGFSFTGAAATSTATNGEFRFGDTGTGSTATAPSTTGGLAVAPAPAPQSSSAFSFGATTTNGTNEEKKAEPKPSLLQKDDDSKALASQTSTNNVGGSSTAAASTVNAGGFSFSSSTATPALFTGFANAAAPESSSSIVQAGSSTDAVHSIRKKKRRDGDESGVNGGSTGALSQPAQPTSDAGSFGGLSTGNDGGSAAAMTSVAPSVTIRFGEPSSSTPAPARPSDEMTTSPPPSLPSFSAPASRPFVFGAAATSDPAPVAREPLAFGTVPTSSTAPSFGAAPPMASFQAAPASTAPAPAASTTMFGAAAPLASQVGFGAPPATSQGGFGSNAFPAPAPATGAFNFTAPSAPAAPLAFGSSGPAPATTTAFSSSAIPPAPVAFGGFGSAAPTASVSNFGSAPAPAVNPFIGQPTTFGSATAPPPAPFGAAPPNFGATSGGFGGQPVAPPPFGASNAPSFGSAPPSQASGFGGFNAAVPPAGASAPADGGFQMGTATGVRRKVVRARRPQRLA